MDILEERGAPGLGSDLEIVGNGCANGVVSASQENCATLIHGFRDQAELLRLLELCPKGSPLKILSSSAQCLEEVLAVFGFGLGDVEVFSPDHGNCVEEGSFSTVLQGANGGDWSVIDALDRHIKYLRPGGDYSILLDDSILATSPGVPDARCPLAYLGRLALWTTSRLSGHSQSYWWQLVGRVDFSPGMITLRLHSFDCQGPSAVGARPLGLGRCGELMAEMQGELNRVFDLYCFAYQEVERLRRETKSIRLVNRSRRRLLSSFYVLVSRFLMGFPAGLYR